MKRAFQVASLIYLIVGFNTNQTNANNQPAKLQRVWINFEPPENVSSPIQLSENKSLLQLSKHDELKQVDVFKDELGYQHYKYQQYYKDIPVERAILLIHKINGKVKSANGYLAQQLNLKTKVSFADDKARRKAINAGIPEITRQQQKTGKKDWQAPDLKGSLVVFERQLAYKYELSTTNPLSHKDIYINANSGEVIEIQEKVHFCSSYIASGESNYSGEVNFSACFKEGTYSLENSIGGGMQVNDFTTDQTITEIDEFFNEDRAAVDVLWATQKTYEYFLNEHSRNSIDGNGISLHSKVHATITNKSLNNAFFFKDTMYYGDGDGERYRSFTSPDIVAHEITHGVTKYAADALIYQGESGALNESFSDIFGEVIEAQSKEIDPDWIVGADIVVYPGFNGLRNLANPNDANMLQVQPDTYLGKNWSDTTGLESLHINSGIQNYWFYLLAEGGSGVNDNGGLYLINAIGVESAAKIAYRNLNVYLTSTSDFTDARNGSIQAAIDFFGAESNEVAQTKKAWCAVGVGEDCQTSENINCRKTDSLNLLILHQATGGENWTKPWNTELPITQWNGVSLNEEGCVKGITLVNNNLKGKIPSEIGQFSKLKTLVLNNNQIGHCLPPEIGQLVELNILNLNNNNDLEGEVPSEIKNLTQLKSLDLSNNQLSGIVLPNILYYLRNLRSLDLSNNAFTGKIPNGTFSLPELEIINLSNNQFDGAIPNQLPILPKLVSFNAPNNQLTGNIPRSFKNITTLKTLLLNDNQLEGSIPAELSELNALVKLHLKNNNLSGCYDKALAKIDEQLVQNENNFISEGNAFDVSWKDFIQNNDLGCASENCRATDSLTLVQLYNAFNGQEWNIQWDFDQAIDTWRGVGLNLNGCVQSLCFDYEFGLSGSIDPAIYNLSALEELSINDANLSGILPEGIQQLQNLSALTIYNSNLSGTIPTGIVELKKLETLNLASNQIKGSIPTEIGNLLLLDRLRLSENQLTGSIPSSIGNLKQLTIASVRNNFLNGPIPAAIGNLQLLKNLQLRDNLLSGSLPNTLSNLSSLEFINLRNNLLNGCYDAQLMMLCDQIYPNNNTNQSISDGNNFNIDWEDFCNYGANYCSSPCRSTDSLALVKLYQSTNGVNWRNGWDLTKPINTWRGVELNEFGCVSTINLNNNRLEGTLPAEIGTIGSLSTLNLSKNDIEGVIIDEIGTLKALSNLDLSHNELTGTLPKALANLTNLNSLNLSLNQFSGSIPSFLEQNIYVQSLNLANNTFSGAIPNSIISLPHLNELYVNNNQLSGCYHPKLSSLCGMLDPSVYNVLGNYRISRNNNFEATWQSFCQNQQGICVPNPCRQADSLSLVTLYQTTDGINWSSAYQWDFTKTMDSWLGVTQNDEGCVTSLSLPAAGLKNELPDIIGNLSHLITLNLWGNALEGNIPSSIGNLSALEILYLPNNQLNGIIPQTLKNLSKLKQLYLQFNDLSGPVPGYLGSLKDLQLVQLHNNQLSGTIPATLADLSKLKNLELENNQLTSCYPEVLQSLCNRENGTFWKISEGNNLDASWQAFCSENKGACPPVYSSQTDSLALLAIYHSANGDRWVNSWDLEAPMLTWYGVAFNGEDRAVSINLSNNNLSGTIADDIGNLDRLQQINISGNQLEGEIPSRIGSIKSLNYLNISNNDLVGCYTLEMNNLCSQLNSSSNLLISEGNQLEASWEGFCNKGVDVCYSGDVWPGDFSNNGIVDIYDVLYWGLANGNSGTSRANASEVWSPQSSVEWDNFINGVNSKHQDGNGDGLVDELDLNLIGVHYGKTHDLNLEGVLTNSSQLKLKAVGIVYEQDQIILTYDLLINTQNGGILNVHGIAGNVDLGDLPVKDVQLDVSNSSIEPQKYFAIHNSTDNTVDIALTRNDKIDKNANGPLARIIIISDDITGGDSFKVKTNGGNTISADGTVRKMGGNTTFGTFGSNIVGTFVNASAENLSVFVSTEDEACNVLGKAEIYITNGTAPFSYNWSNGATGSKQENLTSGSYRVVVTDAEGLASEINFRINGQLPVFDDESNLACGGTCPEFLEVNDYLQQGIIQAGNTLNSKANIIQGEVEFKAGESIILENGFTIDTDTNFTADIENCE